MDVSEESCEKAVSPVEKAVSPVCRSRCNTWHAGLQQLVCSSAGTAALSPVTPESLSSTDGGNNGGTQCGSGVKRSTVGRRNAWGTASYADLIATAIESSPDRRLTLSQIYDWLVTNVQYFRDKADSNSSATWKNSIRHNLSLHRRFTRVSNCDGKSSWWTLVNSDSSAIRWPRTSTASRRRAETMDLRQRRNRRLPVDFTAADHETADKKPLLDNSFLTDANSDCLTSTDDVFNVMPNSTDVRSADFSDSFTFSVRSRINSDSFLSSRDLPRNTDIRFEMLKSSQGSSSFGIRHHSPIHFEPNFASSSSILNEDESSNMMVQSSPAWSHSSGADAGEPSFTNSAGCPVPDDRLSDLFSDVVMSHEDSLSLPGNQGSGSSFDESSSFGSDRQPAVDVGALLQAAYSTVSSSLAKASLRRGSDAPPPSPESSGSECCGSSSQLEFATSASAEMSDAVGGLRPFGAAWYGSFPPKTDDLSSLSDVDMDH